jgi:hypothetical protein
MNFPSLFPSNAYVPPVSNVADPTHPTPGGDAATLGKHKRPVSLLEVKKKYGDIKGKFTLAKQESEEAATQWDRLASWLDSLKGEHKAKTTQGKKDKPLEKLIRQVEGDVDRAIERSKTAGEKLKELRQLRDEAKIEVQRAKEEISKDVPLKETTDRATGPKTILKSTRHKTVPAPPAPKTFRIFSAAIGIGEEPLIDKEGNVNARARANSLIQEKGLGGHLEQIIELERASHSINAGIQNLNALVNEAAPQLVGDGTPIPAVEAAKKHLEKLQTKQGSLDRAIQSAKGQFLAMYNANEVKDFRLKLKLGELINELKSTDFVSLAAVASAAQHGNDARFFLTIARSCFALGAVGLFTDTVVSSLTRRDLELRFLAHGISAGIGAAGVVEWARGNLAGVSESSKTLAFGTCMLASLWALGVW